MRVKVPGMLSKDEEDCFTAVTFPGLASVMSPKRRPEFDLFRKLPSMFPNDRVVHPDAAASRKRCFAIKIYIW